MNRRGKMKWKRLLAACLTVSILTGILPARSVMAAENWTDNAADYDIQMQDRFAGNQSTLSVSNHSYAQTVLFTPMVQGEKTALIYAMPSNGPSRITIYRLDENVAFDYNKVKFSSQYFPVTKEEFEALKNSDARMGALVGFYSLKHYETVSEGGNIRVMPIEGKETIEAGKRELDEMSKQSGIVYGKLTRFPAIGMDGQGPSWYTLKDYYEQIVEGASASVFSMQDVETIPTAETREVFETTMPDSVSLGGKDTPERIALEEAASVSGGNSTALEVTASDGNSTVSDVLTPDEDSLESSVAIEEGDLAEQPEEKTETAEDIIDALAEDEELAISDWDIICPSEETLSLEGIDESQIPEDFYVTRGYLEAFSDANGSTLFSARGSRSGSSSASDVPLYNYVCWRGRYWDETAVGERPDGIPDSVWNSLTQAEKDALTKGAEKVLPAGKYLLAIEYIEGSSLATFENTRFIPVEIVKSVGNTIDPTDGQVVSTLMHDYGISIHPGTGYPTVTDIAWGDPVDLLSGSFAWNYTDLQMEGAYPLAFVRSYASLYAERDEVGLGYGWSHNYQL